MTCPAYVHQALISADAPPRPACDGSGRSVARAADVTCPACLILAVGHKDRTEPAVHDAHAIPADDEPAPVTEAEINPGDLFRDRDDDEWVAVSTGHETFLVDPIFLHTTKQAVEDWGPLVKHLSDCEPISAVEPAKTHDLSIRREFGNVVVGTENGGPRRTVYLPEGVAQDLGRVLDPLTPAQIALLVDDLTGGAK